MAHPLLNSCDTLDQFASTIIAPAVVVARAPLQVRAWQTPGRPLVHEVPGDGFVPVELGWQWGPRWSTCWFELTGDVPTDWSWPLTATGPGRRSIAIGFDSDTEAQLYIGREPVQGFDTNRDTAPLSAAQLAAASTSGVPGGNLRVLVEAACNHPFGAQALQWDTPDVHRRWNSSTPGRLHKAELALIDHTIEDLLTVWRFATGLIRELAPASPPMFTPQAPWVADQAVFQSGRCEQLHQALLRAMRAFPTTGAGLAGRPATARDEIVRTSAAQVLADLRAALARTPGGSALRGHGVGHAHIDTGWLWPVAETRRKCIRTFSNVLGIMDRHESFRFMASSAQHYAFVERDSPALFGKIKQRIAEQRWEPVGQMWIEPDTLCPSPESLIRQILVGTRYFNERFGKAVSDERVLFLPDTFGFSPVLPQISQLSGIRTFVTNKLSWNDTLPYPHTTFIWRGLDGTGLLTHCTPNHDYNAANTPRELVRVDKSHRSKQIAPVTGDAGARFCHPYGFGDGGGGPTREQALRLDLASKCEGVPTITHSGIAAFAKALHADVAEFVQGGGAMPEVDGELYLQAHRGICITHAWLKREMRECEELLRQAELMEVLSIGHLGTRPATAHGLRRAWELLLLNQFHDILPGSSITEVYDVTRQEMQAVRASAQAVIDEVGRGLVAKVGRTTGTLRVRTSSVSTDGQGIGAVRLEPASGSATGAGAALGAPARVEQKADGVTVTASGLGVKVDRLGRIVSLRVGGGLDGMTELLAGPANEMVLREDVPRMWDAWDIDAHAGCKPVVVDSPASRFEVRQEPGHVVIELERWIGTNVSANGLLRQTIRIPDAGGHVEIESELDWQLDRTLLRCETPVALHDPVVTFDMGFGHMARPLAQLLGTGTSAGSGGPGPGVAKGMNPGVMTDVPHHRWVLLQGQAVGLAVVTDCLFGSSFSRVESADGRAAGVRLGTSITRSTNYPAPEADRGMHRWTMRLVPVIGPSGVATAIRAADALVRPALRFGDTVASGMGNAAGGIGGESPLADFVRTEQVGGALVSISAVKVADECRDAERPGVIVVRLVEQAGAAGRVKLRWGWPVAGVSPVNAIEEPTTHAGVRHDAAGRVTECDLRAFEILTLRVELAR